MQFTQVAPQKWVTMSILLRTLTKNEGMSELLVFLANRSFAHFFAKNKRFAKKNNERIPNPLKISLDCPFKEKNIVLTYRDKGLVRAEKGTSGSQYF